MVTVHRGQGPEFALRLQTMERNIQALATAGVTGPQPPSFTSLAGAQDITATGWAPLPDPFPTMEIAPTVSGIMEVDFGGQLFTGEDPDIGPAIYLAVSIDGQEPGGGTWPTAVVQLLVPAGTWAVSTISMPWQIFNVPGGNHSFTLQAYSSNPSTAPAWVENPFLRVTPL